MARNINFENFFEALRNKENISEEKKSMLEKAMESSKEIPGNHFALELGINMWDKYSKSSDWIFELIMAASGGDKSEDEVRDFMDATFMDSIYHWLDKAYIAGFDEKDKEFLNHITLEKIEECLDDTLSYYEDVEEYEKCSTIQRLRENVKQHI